MVSILILFSGIQLNAQSFNPVTWDIELSHDNFSVNNEIEIILKIKIEKNWSLCFDEFDYRKFESGIYIFDDLSFEISDDLIYFGETTKKQIKENNCITCFKKSITFKQKIRIANTPLQLTGKLSYIEKKKKDVIYLQDMFEIYADGIEITKIRTYPL